jgi:hypothetical protein
LIAAVLAGQSTFLEAPAKDLAAFLGLLLHAQIIAHGALVIWSSLLQVMGLSEMEAVTVRRAFGLWLLGQLVTWIGAFLLLVVLNMLGFVANSAGP